jgi:hypothetical protein
MLTFYFNPMINTMVGVKFKGSSTRAIMWGQYLGAGLFIASEGSQVMTSENPLSHLGIKSEIIMLWSIPDHQRDMRCKAPRSDD